MVKIRLFKTVVLCLFFTIKIFSAIHHTLQLCHNKLVNLELTIDVAPDDYLYIDYLTISCDNPEIIVDKWKTNTRIVAHFDPAFNETKKAFKENAGLMIGLTAPNFKAIGQANLHVSYYLKSNNKIITEILSLNFCEPETSNLETQVDIPEPAALIQEKAQEYTRAETNPEKISTQMAPADPGESSWLNWISQTVEQSNSLFVRWILVFLLGLLMSLTPCIYPMIPITAGILQTQGSKSILMSFMLSLSYTLGLATTFAILGLLAAFAGQAIGQFMYHPAFIVPLVLLLIYLALSMIGLYDMYVPRFLQPKDHAVNGGSFISVFAFGAISGIVASPCLSPGLVCLLCIVSTLGSKFLGFILLFAFGVGLSVPLLIIGTFSSSLSLLPRAGMWMVEVKKIFGFVMLGMCFYFLDPILPWAAKAILIPLFVVTIGLYYVYHARFGHSKIMRFMSNLLGVLLIAASLFISIKAYFSYQYKQEKSETLWGTNYEAALQEAQKSHKPVFVDIGAPYCSICKSIDKKLFSESLVKAALAANTVPTKIDGSDAMNAEVMKKFNVIGFPTILLINAQTQQIIKKWGPELSGTTSQEFIAQLNDALKIR